MKMTRAPRAVAPRTPIAPRAVAPSNTNALARAMQQVQPPQVSAPPQMPQVLGPRPARTVAPAPARLKPGRRY